MTLSVGFWRDVRNFPISQNKMRRYLQTSLLEKNLLYRFPSSKGVVPFVSKEKGSIDFSSHRRKNLWLNLQDLYISRTMIFGLWNCGGKLSKERNSPELPKACTCTKIVSLDLFY